MEVKMDERSQYIIICNPTGSHFIECDEEIDTDMFIIKNPNEGINILNNLLYNEMVDRMLSFESIEDEEGDPLLNYDGYLRWIYNKKLPKSEQIPKINVIIDNFETLMKESSGEIEEVVYRIKELGPSAGINIHIFN